MFATDLHGDVNIMRELVKKAIEEGCPVIILGGDLFRAGRSNTIEAQEEFLKAEVQPIFEEFPGEVHTIFGNNDWAHVAARFPLLCPKVKPFDGSSFALDGGLEVAGLSCVPVTPFPMKDWDRVESSGRVDEMARMDGYCSRKGRIEECSVSSERTMKDEIESLGGLEGKLLISHGPPFNTCADAGWGGISLGSRDLRSAIEEQGPIAVLCGHIHEAPDRSGSMLELLGDTWVGNPGSHQEELSVITGELTDTLKLSGSRVRRDF